MTAWGVALALALGASSVRLQPGAARPGDAVLVTVTGARDAPSGRLGSSELTFLPSPAGWQALVGLRVEEPAGQLPLAVQVRDDAGELASLQGALEVLPADFRQRQLTVGKRFTTVSRKDRRRSAEDQRAFRQAFDRDAEPWLFAGPFEWPRRAEVTAPFGDVRLLNGKRKTQHYGLDLDGQRGDPVEVSNDGEVVLVRDCFASGRTVIVHHGGRLFTTYFHLTAVLVKQGAQVRRGQRLGTVGSTGRVTGPHLHWGAKLDGRWVDPESLLRLDFSR